MILFGWILFRSQSIDLAVSFLGRLAVPGDATLWSAPVVLAIVVVIGLQLLPEKPLERLQVRIERVRPAVLGVGFAVLVLFVGATVSSQGVAPFIYFRF